MTLLVLALWNPAHAEPVSQAIAEIAPLRALRQCTDAPEIPADAYAALAVGNVQAGVIMVEEEKAGKGWGLALYDAPIEAVWMAINDQDNVIEGRPVEVSSVVSGPVTGTGRHLFQSLRIPLFKNRWWLVEIHHNAPLYTASQARVWEQHWADVPNPPHLPEPLGTYQDDGMSLAWTKGAWMLVDLQDGRTLAEYFVWTDPGGSIPAGPVSRFAVGSIKKVLTGIGELAAHENTRPRVGFVRPDQSPLDTPVLVQAEADTEVMGHPAASRLAP